MEGAESTAKDSVAGGSSASGGHSRVNSTGEADLPPGAGVIPRLCTNLFKGLAAMGATRDAKGSSADTSPVAGAPTATATGAGVQTTFSITAQYVEIYNERIIDLLTASTSSTSTANPGGDDDSDIKIRQTPGGSIVMEGAITRPCATASDVSRLLKEGQARRTRGETNMNSLSSRSHAVLTLHVNVTRTEVAADAGAGNAAGAPVSVTRSCKLSLIDLAGSERADATGATGARLKEGAQINLSLTCLGRVINALTTMPEGSISSATAQAAAAAATGTTAGANLKGSVHVPYRDSKLTRLLQDSLGGSAFTCMIACISPAGVNYEETLATLRFAQRAKKVTNAAKVQLSDPAQARLAALNAEVRSLRAKVIAYEAALLRRAVPGPVSSQVADLGREEGAQALVGGKNLVLAALKQYGSPEAIKAAQKKKSACAIM